MPDNSPVTGLTQSLADLPISDSGEVHEPESPPVINPAHSLAEDLPISNLPSPATPTVADTDLPSQTPPPSFEPPSNDVLVLERNRRPAFLTRHLLWSLGIVTIAVAISFFMRSVTQTLGIGRHA